MARGYENAGDWFDDEDVVHHRDEGGDWTPRRRGDRRGDRMGARSLELVRAPFVKFSVSSPDSFEVAQEIADHLRAGEPVLVDLGACDRQLTGRLIDFCSGLVYALDGGFQQVGTDVLLLTPRVFDVSGDEASAVRTPGFYNRR